MHVALLGTEEFILIVNFWECYNTSKDEVFVPIRFYPLHKKIKPAACFTCLISVTGGKTRGFGDMDKIILLFKMLLRQERGRFVADRETEDRIWRTVLRTRIKKRKKRREKK